MLKLVENEALTRHDFDEFWWLERSLLEESPILNVKDPATVKGKGRPRGSGPFAGPETKAPEAPPSTAPAVLQTSTPPVPASRTNPRPTKPSVRRNRFQWEESDIDELEAGAALVTVRPAKRPATSAVQNARKTRKTSTSAAMRASTSLATASASATNVPAAPAGTAGQASQQSQATQDYIVVAPT